MGRLAAISLLIGVSGLALNGCGKGAAKDAAESATGAIPVQVELPSRGEMLSVYAGTAPLQADQEATVVAKVGGEVREILVEEGDRVKAGQALARLDGDRLRFELQQTEVNLRKLEREYQRTLELFNRKLVASAAVTLLESRDVRWRQGRRSTQNVFENPPAPRHWRCSIGDRSHQEYASLAEQTSAAAIRKSYTAEPASVNVGNTIVPGQTLIDKRRVRFVKVHDTTVFANNAFEEELCLEAESLTQVVIELRRGRVRIFELAQK